MSSPRTPGTDAFEDPAGQPTEEEMRAYVEQLRAADPAGIVVQAYQLLGTGAEVKLGLPDARLLIDAMGALVAAVEGRVEGQLAEQMKAGVGQLQNAQVQVEAELREQGQPGGDAQPSPPREPAAGPAAQQQGGGQQQKTNRLWIPGRDQGPP